MNDINKNDLLYVCTLIEYMGRETKNRRSYIVEILGKDELIRLLDLAEVNHCLSLEQVSDELITEYKIQVGEFDSVGSSLYTVPSIDAIAKDYMYLIIDTIGEFQSLVDALITVMTSFITDEITDFNSSVYYSNPNYLKESYLHGELLA